MEADSFIRKTNFFAADGVLGNAYVGRNTPSTQLANLMQILDESFEKIRPEMLTFAKARLPAEMAILKADSRGALNMSVEKTANLLGTGNDGISIPGSGVVPITIMDTIMEGAMPFTAYRNALETTGMTSDTKTVPFFTKRVKIPACSPSADAFDIAQDLAHGTLRAKTFKAAATVSGELLDDAQSRDLYPSILREMGGDMEVTLDAYCAGKVLANASATPISVAETGNCLQAIASAQGQIGQDGYMPDKVIVSPLFAAELMKQFIPAYNAPAQEEMFKTSLLARWMGLDILRSGSVPDGSASWGWSAANNIGAIVLDRSKIGYLGIREDMAFDDFDNVIKWAKTSVLRSRFDYAPAVDQDKPSRNNKLASVLIKRSA